MGKHNESHEKRQPNPTDHQQLPCFSILPPLEYNKTMGHSQLGAPLHIRLVNRRWSYWLKRGYSNNQLGAFRLLAHMPYKWFSDKLRGKFSLAGEGHLKDYPYSLLEEKDRLFPVPERNRSFSALKRVFLRTKVMVWYLQIRLLRIPSGPFVDQPIL